jgi:hypothetical protein
MSGLHSYEVGRTFLFVNYSFCNMEFNFSVFVGFLILLLWSILCVLESKFKNLSKNVVIVFYVPGFLRLLLYLLSLTFDLFGPFQGIGAWRTMLAT